MATITGLNKTRMLAIEAASVVGGTINGSGHLILTTNDASTIDAGSVIGPTGLTPSLLGSSTSSVAIATGSKTFAISPSMNVAFPVGTVVKASGVTATNYMVGQVTSASTSSVTINVTEIGGSGTFASWTLTIGSYKGADGTLSGAAGGDLTGTWPSPTIVSGAVTDTKVAAANKDGVATTASMRTLGTGSQQAAAGNHTHSIIGVLSRTPAAGSTPSVPSGGALTVVTMDTNDGPTMAGFTANAGNDTFTCTVAGLYMVSGSLAFQSPASGTGTRRSAAIFVSGAQYARTEINGGASGIVSCPIAAKPIRLVVGDTLDIRAFQNNGSPLLLSLAGQCYISALRVGP